MELIEMLTNLVGLNSESRISNRTITDFIHSLLINIGFKEEDIKVTSVRDSNGAEKCNIIAKKGRGENGLMLAGHMDTVSAQPIKSWRTDPFELIRKENNLYGLGTTDMKLFLAAAIKTAETFSAERLIRPLALVFTCDEEIGLLGAKHLKRENLLTGIRYGIVGEPTELKPARMHKGYISAEAIIRGQSGHSGNPKKRINAIERAYQFLTALIAYREDELNDYWNDLLEPPYPTLNIGAINGGKETNRVPNECRIKFDIRPIPGQSANDIVNDLKGLANKLEMVDDKPGAEIKFHSKPTEPMETSASSLIVKAAEQVTGKKATGVPYATEAAVYNEAGLETVILGPGDIAQAHQPNEFVDVKYLETTVKTLWQIVTKLCLERS